MPDGSFYGIQQADVPHRPTTLVDERMIAPLWHLGTTRYYSALAYSVSLTSRPAKGAEVRDRVLDIAAPGKRRDGAKQECDDESCPNSDHGNSIEYDKKCAKTTTWTVRDRPAAKPFVEAGR